MVSLNNLFHPITAQPFHADTDLHASHPPCPALAPFVASYWGTRFPTAGAAPCAFEPSLIIPDACVDLIFTVDHAGGTVTSAFGGFSDRPILAYPLRDKPNRSRFAIRFPFWAARWFAQAPLVHTYGLLCDPEAYFPDWKRAFADMLVTRTTLDARAAWTDAFLLARLPEDSGDANLLNALYYILKTRGVSPVAEACAYAAVGPRRLERLFAAHIGASPKRVAGLVRYQNLWSDLARGALSDMQDAVDKYRYADQAHLLNDFKQHHSVTPAQAVKIARPYVAAIK